MNHSTHSSEPDLYKVSDLMRRTGFGRSKVFAILKSGSIPSFKFDGSRRVRRSDFETWLEQVGRPNDE